MNKIDLTQEIPALEKQLSELNEKLGPAEETIAKLPDLQKENEQLKQAFEWKEKALCYMLERFVHTREAALVEQRVKALKDAIAKLQGEGQADAKKKPEGGKTN